MNLQELYLQSLEDTRKVFDEKLGAHIVGMETVKELKANGFFDRVEHLAIKPYERHVEDMLNLVGDESELELKWRQTFVRQYIELSGLTKFQDEIIDGMNKTCGRVTMWDDSPKIMHVLQQRTILHHDSSALLKFALDYVDRWKMYNELFGNNSTSQIF